VADVVALRHANITAREAAGSIAMLKRSAQRRRNRSGSRSQLGEPSVCIVAHHHPTRITREASGRFRRNVCAVLEDGLARLIRIREYLRIHMNDDLVALTRRPGIQTLMEGRLHE